MDKPFQPSQWLPSRPFTATETLYPHHQIVALIANLNTATHLLILHPYDPTLWLTRALTLSQLRYPELAVGDAHKATLLCRSLLRDLDQKPNFRLGLRAGFWLLDDDDEEEAQQSEDERERLQGVLAGLRYQAEKAVSGNLYFAPGEESGRCVLLAYPWMEERHTFRSGEVFDLVNRELEDSAGSGRVACEVRRYAFGEGVGACEGADCWGVFATRDIEKDEVIVVDKSRTWVQGCNGPGLAGSSANLSGGIGCMDPLHPNSPSERADQDLRWIRDRSGKEAADALLKCRFLYCSIIDGANHPLDHLAARLTPMYRRNKFRNFSLESDIAVLNRALQQFGIDIFANLNYDTWVFFILMARIDNNSWSDPNTSSVNTLFSMFNHSCEENVKWQILIDHRTIEISAARDLKEGEQLFVCYDGFHKNESLKKRRKRFWRWLDGPCQCGKCTWEEAELQSSGGSSMDASFSSSSSAWDSEEKPVFPEDDRNEAWSLLRAQD